MDKKMSKVAFGLTNCKVVLENQNNLFTICH